MMEGDGGTMMYTTEPSSRSVVMIIVACCIGGGVLIALCLVTVLCMLRARKSRGSRDRPERRSVRQRNFMSPCTALPVTLAAADELQEAAVAEFLQMSITDPSLHAGCDTATVRAASLSRFDVLATAEDAPTSASSSLNMHSRPYPLFFLPGMGSGGSSITSQRRQSHSLRPDKSPGEGTDNCLSVFTITDRHLMLSPGMSASASAAAAPSLAFSLSGAAGGAGGGAALMDAGFTADTARPGSSSSGGGRRRFESVPNPFVAPPDLAATITPTAAAQLRSSPAGSPTLVPALASLVTAPAFSSLHSLAGCSGASGGAAPAPPGTARAGSFLMRVIPAPPPLPVPVSVSAASSSAAYVPTTPTALAATVRPTPPYVETEEDEEEEECAREALQASSIYAGVSKVLDQYYSRDGAL